MPKMNSIDQLDDESEKKLNDLFNIEQGKYMYYTVALSATMIGYLINLILSTQKILLIFPIISLIILGFSFFMGISAIKYRLFNYRLPIDLKDGYEKFNKDKEYLKQADNIYEKKSNIQEWFLVLHEWFLIMPSLLLIIWIIILNFNKLF